MTKRKVSARTENVIAIMLTLMVIYCAVKGSLTADIVAIYSFILGYFFSDSQKKGAANNERK